MWIRGIDEQLLYVDYRCLKDTRAKKFLGHTGYNINIVRQAIGHPPFTDLSLQVTGFTKGSQKELPCTTKQIMFVCTSGAHRSVATAKTMKTMLMKDGISNECRYVSSGNWYARAPCATCPDCNDTSAHDRVMEEVYEVWKNL